MNITEKTIVAALGETDFAISSGSKKWMKRALKAALSTVEQTPGDPAPQDHSVGVELPADVVESLLAIGTVEWGVSLTQSDERHASDLLDTLRITRDHFGVTDEETAIHGVYLEGTGTVLAHTGMSPNSPQHARILVGAWNQLVEIARAQHKTRKVVRHG